MLRTTTDFQNSLLEDAATKISGGVIAITARNLPDAIEKARGLIDPKIYFDGEPTNRDWAKCIRAVLVELVGVIDDSGILE